MPYPLIGERHGADGHHATGARIACPASLRESVHSHVLGFFAGGGLVREGLGRAWRCTYALDWSQAKAATYRANFGDGELRVEDIRTVDAADLPKVKLVTATFPCQDHSCAGEQAGFDGGERGVLVFWFLSLMADCLRLGTAPDIVLLENVLGLLEADDGRDFEAVLTGLTSLGFRVGPIVVDAIHFVPQSRPRVFVVAVAPDVAIPAALLGRGAQGAHHPWTLVRAVSALPPPVARHLVWWRLPAPPVRTADLADVVEPYGSASERWRDRACQTAWKRDPLSAPNRDPFWVGLCR